MKRKEGAGEVGRIHSRAVEADWGIAFDNCCGSDILHNSFAVVVVAVAAGGGIEAADRTAAAAAAGGFHS